MRSRPFLLLAAILALFLAGSWYFLPGPGRPLRSRETKPRPAAAGTDPSAPGGRSVPPLGHPAGEEPSHLADGLDSPGGDVHADLRIVNEILRQYRSAVHGLNPVGENTEIVAVLTGRNPLDFAFIPRGHPAINARGELCDRWGSAYFFHQLSGTQMEIRSAGPDRVLWTDDDVVLTPGLRLPPR